MAIQPMALGVNNPEINAVSALAAGQQARQSFDMNNVQIAKAGLETIGSIALGAMGGNIDGQADPALFNQGLDYLAQQGVNVDQFRDRADLAPVIARSSMTALQQMSLAQNEQTYQLALDKFELDVMQAAQGPKPTAEMQNFGLAQSDPAFAAHLAAQNAPNPPADVAAYDAYAADEKAAGREPLGRLEYQQALKGQGFSVTTADGTVVQMGGSGKPLTEGQSKDTVYATRAEGALPIINELGSELMNPVARGVEGDPTGLARGTFQSENFQKAQQAGKEFLQAILRKDTGAAITPQEQAEYGSVYLPVPGDTPGVLVQKEQSRLRALEAIKAGLPPQAILAQERALANTNAAASAPSPAASGGIAEGTIIENDAGERMVLQGGQWVKQ